MKRLVYAAMAAMVLFTGGYLVVYTARWEWQRALAAGQLLLISLLVLVGLIVVDRFGRLERKINELSARTGAPEGAGSLSPAPSGPPPTLPEQPKFRWLQPESNSYGVFIPVLLGAGIAVSGLAALVERIAAGFGRGTAAGRRLIPLQVPAGGVLAGAPALTTPSAQAHGGARTARGRLRLFSWVLAVALIAGLAIYELAERTQDRPDAPVKAAASTLILQVTTNDGVPADPVVRRAWEYARGSVRPYLQDGGLVALGNGRYALVVQPALGEHAIRRLKGSLQDSVVDHGKVKVVSISPTDD